jgi:hypothetical protein
MKVTTLKLFELCYIRLATRGKSTLTNGNKMTLVVSWHSDNNLQKVIVTPQEKRAHDM